jgi:iron complex transport system substrate-binding protein
MQPDQLLFRIKQKQTLFEYLQKSGLKSFNGDWTNNPLGKAEWIKFLYGLDSKRIQSLAKLNTTLLCFSQKATKANSSQRRCSKINGTYHKATVTALFLKDAQADYLWRDTKGTGSASLPFEVILEKRNKQNSDCPW